MFSLSHKGDFKNLEKFMQKSLGRDYMSVLESYGQRGVQALSAATPIDTGLAASSWEYEIDRSSNGISIIWKNTDIENGVNVAILLQYGHGTRNGGYVVGQDYINPALQPIFEELAEAAWKEVTSL